MADVFEAAPLTWTFECNGDQPYLRIDGLVHHSHLPDLAAAIDRLSRAHGRAVALDFAAQQPIADSSQADGGGRCEFDIFALPAQLESCREARHRVDRVAGSIGFGKPARDEIMLAIGEAATNAVRHGGSGEPDDTFMVVCLATAERLCVSISDSGPGFDPDSVPPVEDSLSWDSGRGIHCMRAMMDEVHFDFNSGTTVRMVKFRTSP